MRIMASERLRRAIDRSPFGRIVDAEAELTQLGAIRIATGVLCAARLLPQVWASRYYFEAGPSGVPPLTIDGIGVLALIVLVTAGVFAPVSTLALLFVTRWYEGELASESLSTEILSMLLTLLVLSSAGARWSIDAVLMRRSGVLGSVVRGLYRLVGVPSTSGMRAILVLCFLAVGLMNLGGAVNHWFEEAWRDGRAMSIILSSAYMSRVWPWWRAFESRMPEAAVWTGWVLTMAQLAAQTTIVALVWWRPTSRLVIAWGVVFYVSSIVALQLHYLGAFELLTWMAIFHRPRPSTAPSLRPFVRRRWTERTIAWGGALFLLVFVAHEAWAWAGEREYPLPKLRLYIDTVGLHSPRVFNHNDLALGDAWCIVYRGDRQERLPYHGPRGERLAWTQWNDLLLYRSSIRWRNEFNPANVLDPTHELVGRLQQLVVFDHRRRDAKESAYVIDYFTAPVSQVELPPATRFERQFLGSTRFRCSGEGNAARCLVGE